MTADRIIEAVGIAAAIGVTLLVGLCIVANAAFKRIGLPDDDGGER